MLCLAQCLSPPAGPQRRSDRCVLTPLGTPWRAIDGHLLQHAPAWLIVPRVEDGLRYLLCGHAQLLRTESAAPLRIGGRSTLENLQAVSADRVLGSGPACIGAFGDRRCALPWSQGVSHGDMSPVGAKGRPSSGRRSRCGSPTTLVLRVEA